MSRHYQDGRATSFHDTLAVCRPHLRFRKVQAKRARTLASADLQRPEALAMTDTPDRDSVPIPLLHGRLTNAPLPQEHQAERREMAHRSRGIPLSDVPQVISVRDRSQKWQHDDPSFDHRVGALHEPGRNLMADLFRGL